MTCVADLQIDLDAAAKREQQLHDQLSAAASQLAAAQAQLAAQHHLQDQLTAVQARLKSQARQTASANQACKDALVCHSLLLLASSFRSAGCIGCTFPPCKVLLCCGNCMWVSDATCHVLVLFAL